MCKLFVNVLDNVGVIVHLNTGFIDKALFDFFSVITTHMWKNYRKH